MFSWQKFIGLVIVTHDWMNCAHSHYTQQFVFTKATKRVSFEIHSDYTLLFGDRPTSNHIYSIKPMCQR